MPIRATVLERTPSLTGFFDIDFAPCVQYTTLNSAQTIHAEFHSSLVYRAAAVAGVQLSREFAYQTIQRQRRGRPLRIAVLGLSWPADRGAWIPLTGGQPLGQAHYEMIVDKTLRVSLVEQITLGQETYTVVGTTNNMINCGGDGLALFRVPTRKRFGSKRRTKRFDWNAPPENHAAKLLSRRLTNP